MSFRLTTAQSTTQHANLVWITSIANKKSHPLLNKPRKTPHINTLKGNEGSEHEKSKFLVRILTKFKRRKEAVIIP
jgi:hypothetical protein